MFYSMNTKARSVLFVVLLLSIIWSLLCFFGYISKDMFMGIMPSMLGLGVGVLFGVGFGRFLRNIICAVFGTCYVGYIVSHRETIYRNIDGLPFYECKICYLDSGKLHWLYADIPVIAGNKRAPLDYYSQVYVYGDWAVIDVATVAKRPGYIGDDYLRKLKVASGVVPRD